MTPAKRLIIIGSVLILLAAALYVFVPTIGLGAIQASSTGQSALIAAELAIRFISAVVPALGAAILSGGIVLSYVSRDGGPGLPLE